MSSILQKKQKELIDRWDRLSHLFTEVSEQRDLETRVEEQIRLDQKIKQLEEERSTVEEQIDALESKKLPTQNKPIRIFYSYAHEDEALRDELAKHLSVLKRQGFIQSWHDRDINAGSEWAAEIDHQLEKADIILLLISPDFISSDYCWCNEMEHALHRHQEGNARVIPVILRDTDWSTTSISKLQALPSGGKAVTLWDDKDSAFTDITKNLRQIVDELKS